MSKVIEPGSYVMRPNFIKNRKRTKRLTRLVRVLYVKRLCTEFPNGRRKRASFVHVLELTEGPDAGELGRLWHIGDKSLAVLDCWDFTPVE